MSGPHYTAKGDRYLLRLPGENKAKGFTRCTTFIKALDTAEGLIPWAATAAIVGMHRRPGLAAKWAALCAEFPDPWYADDDAKKRCKALFEECKDAGGASDRADIGDALHDMVRVLNRSGSLGALGALHQRDIDAYQRCLAEAGITPDPEWCEVTLYNALYGVVGQVDGMFRVDGRPLHVIGDLKTGGSGEVVDGKVDGVKPQAFGAQLAMYQGSETRVIWPADKEAECELVPVPETDAELGIIIHLPAGKGLCTLYKVDLVEGRIDLEVAAKWRERRNFGQRKDTICTPLLTTVSESPATPSPEAPEIQSQPVEGPAPDAGWDEAAALREWLIARLLNGHAEQGKPYLDSVAAAWPIGVPTFQTAERHSLTDLALIEAVIVAADAEHSVSWPTEQPTFPPPETPFFLARHGGPAPDVGVNDPSPLGVEGSPPAAGDPFDFDQRPAVPSTPNAPASLPASADWCAGTVEQLRTLPPDLLAWLEARCVGIPNLTSGKVTVDHAMHLGRVLRWATWVHRRRWDRIRTAQEQHKLTDDDAATLAKMASGGKRTVDRLTEADTWRLLSLFQAVQEGWTPVWDDQGRLSAIGVPQEASRAASARHGGARPAIAAAKAQALELGLDAPRSLVEAMADPVLAAQLTYGVTDAA